MRLLIWMKEKKNKDTDRPNKPLVSPFTQQALPAGKFEVTASSMLPLLFCLAVAFIPIGIVFITADGKVLEKAVEYTDCELYSCDNSYNSLSGSKRKCCKVFFTLPEEYSGQVYMYYKLDNFFQNHQTYVRSKDDEQLHGEIKNTLSPNCKDPYRLKTEKHGNQSFNFKIAPCGAIANSLFNDTFKLVYVQVGPDLDVTLTHKDVTWPKEKNGKFRNPVLANAENGTLKGAYKDFASPPNWQNYLYDLSLFETDNNANLNSDLIVWFRTAAFPTFRKLHRKVVHSGPHFVKGLPKGNYRMDLQYNFPVKSFGGKKFFVISTSSWLGGKNSFLGVTYLVTGVFCLLAGFLSTLLHMKSRTRSSRVSDDPCSIELKEK